MIAIVETRVRGTIATDYVCNASEKYRGASECCTSTIESVPVLRSW